MVTNVDSLLDEDAILNDFSVSYWLKCEILNTRNRDCLDALQDAEILVALLEQRCLELRCIARK